MIYDEVSVSSFLGVLSLISPQPGEVFYDLGSGVGEKVIAAAHAFPFAKCVGVEMVQELYQASENAKKKYVTLVPKDDLRIEFLRKDFNTHDFSGGDVFFLSLVTVAMKIELYGRLKKKLEGLKKGVRFITTDVPFVSPYFSYTELPIAKFKKGEKNNGENAVFFVHIKVV